MKQIKITLYLIILLAVIVPILTPLSGVAQINANLIKDAATGAEFPDVNQAPEITIPQTIGRLVSIILSLVGVLFFIFIVVAGISWMTAGGNEEKVAKARKNITQSIIGLAITVAAYFITWFISNALGAA